MQDRSGQALLAGDEPAPFEVLNAASELPLLLLCDHASARIPRALEDLGIAADRRYSHLAWDIGAGELTRRLAAGLAATAVLAGYSRLVVDCNRSLAQPDAFLEFGDGTPIPGNHGLAPEERAARADAVYRPYHDAVAGQVRRLAELATAPMVFGVHSFAPVVDGVARPWEFGVLWNADEATARQLIGMLAAAGFVVGDNQPYSARLPCNFTLEHHAQATGLPHAIIEVRQDILGDAAAIARIAAVLMTVITRLPALAGSELAGQPRRSA